MQGRPRLTIGLLVIYWLAFVWLGADWAHNPGFVMHPERVPYPVRDVVIVSGFIGLLVAALGLFVLWPMSWHRWARAAFRTVYVLFLILLLMAGMVTDMPGIVYVPPAYALTTLLLLGVLALGRAEDDEGPSQNVV